MKGIHSILSSSVLLTSDEKPPFLRCGNPNNLNHRICNLLYFFLLILETLTKLVLSPYSSYLVICNFSVTSSPCFQSPLPNIERGYAIP